MYVWIASLPSLHRFSPLQQIGEKRYLTIIFITYLPIAVVDFMNHVSSSRSRPWESLLGLFVGEMETVMNTYEDNRSFAMGVLACMMDGQLITCFVVLGSCICT
jgi:hypothetical protein